MKVSAASSRVPNTASESSRVVFCARNRTHLAQSKQRVRPSYLRNTTSLRQIILHQSRAYIKSSHLHRRARLKQPAGTADWWGYAPHQG